MPLTELERLLVLTACAGTTGLALRDHAPRSLRAPPGQLRRRGRRPHVPVGRRLPHGRDLLHRRLGHVLLADPRRGRPRRSRGRGGHARSSWSSATAAGSAGSRTSASTSRARSPTWRATTPGCANEPGLAARDPGRRHRPAQHREPLLLRPERLLRLRRREPAADPRHGRVPRARRRRRAVPAHVRRAVLADRGDGRAGVRGATRACSCSRRWAWAGGCSTASTATRCSAPRAIRTSRASASATTTRRALAAPEPDRPRRRVRGLLPAAPRRHGGGGGGVRRAQVRAGRPSTTRRRRARGGRATAIRGAAAAVQRRVQGLRRPPAPVHPRHVRQVPGHRADASSS